MTKELEDLEKLISVTCGGERLLANVKKALTPPTADELCEELSEYFGTEVLHNTYEHDDINETFMRDAFYRVRIKKDMDDKPYKVKSDIVAGGSDGITFNAWLPPRLIKRIAQFYENEVKE